MAQIEFYIIRTTSDNIVRSTGRRRTDLSNGYTRANKAMCEITEDYGPCELEVLHTYPLDTPETILTAVAGSISVQYDLKKVPPKQKKISHNPERQQTSENCEVMFVFSHSRQEYFIVKCE